MDIKKRVNRIVGQLRGIEKMVGEKRDCSEVLQQISAIKKAIDSLSKEIVVSEMCQIMPKTEAKKIERMVERVISL
ncbi:MAG: metal-sensitive transcriptional regulator [Microgenomates group bacterium]|nr:metal-sensitive transcriptional regulator [Microgenomates group bacterium]